MGQETVGVCSFQATLQDKVDGGQRVARCVGMAFRHPLGAGGGGARHHTWAVTLKRTMMPSGVTSKCLVSSPSDTTLRWHWLDGVSSFDTSAEDHSRSTGGSAGGTPRRCPGLRPGFGKISPSTFPIAAERLRVPFRNRECCSSAIVVFILRVVLGMLCGTLLAALAYDLQ